MIFITFDESGNFETTGNEPKFISGFIFDDCGEEQEIDKERKRVKYFYNKVLKDVEKKTGIRCSYPEDFHSNGDKCRDQNVIRQVKLCLGEHISEFISDATYDGNQLSNAARKGKYHLFCILKSAEGKKRLLSSSVSNFIADNYGANLYFHMVSMMVDRLIFHNPLFCDKSIPMHLDFPERSVEDNSGNLKKIGYHQPYNLNNDKMLYKITNSDVFRTIIAKEMNDSDKLDVAIDEFYVHPIKYTDKYYNMEFLYLADSICSELSFALRGKYAASWVSNITNKMNEINRNQSNIFWGYDDIDDYFDMAWKCMERKNAFECLQYVYAASKLDGQFANYYNEKWFPLIEEFIIKKANQESVYSSVNALYALLTMNNLDQDKLFFLLTHFEKILERICTDKWDERVKSEVFYKLYDAGITAFCHKGMAVQACEYYEKSKKHAFYAGVDSFLHVTNKLVECLLDGFDWEKAFSLIEEAVESQEQVSAITRRLLNQDNDFGFLSEAKMISQNGKVLATMRDKRAESVFKKALSKMKRESANYKITQSYLLHYYADMNMKKSFEAEATDYFDGRDSYAERFEYIAGMRLEDKSLFSINYAFYVLLRGMYMFGEKDVDAKLWNKIKKMDELIKTIYKGERSGHPWEIVYKYIVFMALDRSDGQTAQKYEGYIEKCVGFNTMGSAGVPNIILDLIEFGKIEIADMRGSMKARDQRALLLLEHLRNSYRCLNELPIPDGGDKQYCLLKKYFSFMYH
ncbi:hypothetical protein [Anaerovibrio sp.]|uniref:hypothetical protein n=1 Tax=Anaerovibrio sp. TaxID=1872532 RepID=UPI00261FC2CB|nr:hypothetical protein [Anaerovibrio sp.]MDD6597610.1 hypothetical protein [Anaerovibrio sp.]